MHGVDDEQRAHRARQAARQREVIHRAERVRRRADGEQLGAGRDLGGHVVRVEHTTGGVEPHFADDGAALLEPQPRPAIRFVVELRDEYLVTGLERGADGAGQGEVERRHVLAERDALRAGCAEKAGDPFAGEMHPAVHLPRWRKIAMRVDVAGVVAVHHRLDHGVRYLAAARAVEKRRFAARMPATEGREVPTAAFTFPGGEGHYSRSYVKS